MFFLYKLAGSLIVPPGIFSVALILFAYLAWRRPRKKILASILIISSITLWFMSTPFGAHCVTGPLENMYARQLPPEGTDCAVLVLGGGSAYNTDGKPQPNVHALERVVCGVTIAKKLDCPLILSGGNVYGYDDKSEAEVMEDCAKIIGWKGKTFLDKESRTTKENMLYAKELLSNRVIVLVTNAFHMPRSVYCAKRYIPGVKLYPYSSGTLTNNRFKGIPRFLPEAGSFASSCLGVKEWIGMVVYSLR